MQSPQDVRQQLWGVIFEAGSKQLVESISEASAFTSGGIVRLQRLFTPPPLGMSGFRLEKVSVNGGWRNTQFARD